MAEIVVDGTAVGYRETPWNMADERTGEIRKGVSNKLKVRVAAPGTGTLTVKVPEDVAVDVRTFAIPVEVHLVFDVDTRGQMVLTDAREATPADALV